jgi:hypothetical protein
MRDNAYTLSDFRVDGRRVGRLGSCHDNAATSWFRASSFFYIRNALLPTIGVSCLSRQPPMIVVSDGLRRKT